MLQRKGGLVSANKPFRPDFKQLGGREGRTVFSDTTEVCFACLVGNALHFKAIVQVPLSKTVFLQNAIRQQLVIGFIKNKDKTLPRADTSVDY